MKHISTEPSLVICILTLFQMNSNRLSISSLNLNLTLELNNSDFPISKVLWYTNWYSLSSIIANESSALFYISMLINLNRINSFDAWSKNKKYSMFADYYNMKYLSSTLAYLFSSIIVLESNLSSFNYSLFCFWPLW